MFVLTKTHINTNLFYTVCLDSKISMIIMIGEARKSKTGALTTGIKMIRVAGGFLVVVFISQLFFNGGSNEKAKKIC